MPTESLKRSIAILAKPHIAYGAHKTATGEIFLYPGYFGIFRAHASSVKQLTEIDMLNSAACEFAAAMNRRITATNAALSTTKK